MIIPWWMLLSLIFAAWFLWVVAVSAVASVQKARNPLPDGQQRGFSCVQLVLIPPLGFWAIALLIDWIADPWGTWIIGLLHTFFALLLLASIVQSFWQLWSIEKPRQ